ncbi:hypothetical protein RZA67_10195 [Stenotrophomonas sp. C3(2023)]|uniref:hypothetical protein n=1 Tax=Stenotrophomonas sp. C3(2023) TaxID=3080277 RepID=UPI00293C7BB1|nr:hypothetical protein [Stenotrophomonas sp. C3(2023)]MDV3469096.1 hypothetical protein [Stenotrophomonas sp. C3(2023)]
MKPVYPLALLGLVLAAPACAADIRVNQPVPYAENAIIAEAIKAECGIGTTLSVELATKANALGNTLIEGAVGADSGAGRSLKLEFVEAQSAGNAFIGHFKSAAVRGELYEDGTRVATVTARRISRGGALGGFKGSCAVLDRVVTAIAGDLATWLAAPTDSARLGDF